MSEYYWGYAAAANAHLINPFGDKKRTTKPPRLQPPRDVGEQADEEEANSTSPPPPPQRSAARSNSTSRAFGRPRFRAHTRTTSTDSGSSSSRGAGYRSSHDTPPSAPAASSAAAREDSSDRERREHEDRKEDKEHKEHKEHRSRWHHRWASASATKGAATPAASPSLPQPQTPRSSPAPWSVPDDFSPASAPASPAAPGSASSRPRLLQKPSPIASATTPEHTLPRHQVPSSPSSPLGRLPHKQLPATLQGGTALQAESATAYSKSERSFSAVTSPSKASLSQRITQHLADRRQNQQATGSRVPQASLLQTQSQQRQHHAPVLRESPAIQKITVPFARVESNSSGSGATVSSARTTMSATDPPPAADGPPYKTGPHSSARPGDPKSRRHFVVRNGRTYLADPTLDYPLPVDLPELHRCSMKTLMLFQLFGGPIVSPLFQDRPPARILDLACGSGFWSMMCHRYWSRKGHPNIHFTGVDIAPIPGASGWGVDDPAPSGSSASSMSDGTGPAASLRPPDKDMKWRFVQHDIRRFPWPFKAGEFDFVMMQSTSTVAPFHMSQSFTTEILRVLRPGGTIEIWESDFIIRMLRPHVPAVSAAVPGGWSSAAAAAAATTASNAGPDSDGNEDDEDDDDDNDDASNNGSSDSKHEPSERRKEASRNGAYVVTANTPMSSPLNNFLVEYNAWVTKGLAACQLTPVPCTTINYNLLQEDQLTSVGSRRLAVPLSEVKWEREGVGGVVTKGDGKSYVSTVAKAGKGGEEGGGGEGSSSISGSVGAGSGSNSKGRGLSPNQAALRRTALETVVQLIQSLEPLLREASGKSQDEWDAWQGKMQNNLLLENGTSWGECLEVGAWYARKK
ncbi:SAM binding domain-containing protein containing protein [Magnaporthiopsis poae ATCC 64411]|uniref:SAM binding domain-containing protein containing protein n=1 Tax=Magnaporthiopsis poae (strain ATCC 64411 / 73-15) TaxID=644358 RepID=A0A0C4DWA1_MAGP6|nr:SAM binding domain-containing protein containing protein [Magnaporthiopsis poae ATCC 64411]